MISHASLAHVMFFAFRSCRCTLLGSCVAIPDLNPMASGRLTFLKSCLIDKTMMQALISGRFGGVKCMSSAMCCHSHRNSMEFYSTRCTRIFGLNAPQVDTCRGSRGRCLGFFGCCCWFSQSSLRPVRVLLRSSLVF